MFLYLFVQILLENPEIQENKKSLNNEAYADPPWEIIQFSIIGLEKWFSEFWFWLCNFHRWKNGGD